MSLDNRGRKLIQEDRQKLTQTIMRSLNHCLTPEQVKQVLEVKVPGVFINDGVEVKGEFRSLESFLNYTPVLREEKEKVILTPEEKKEKRNLKRRTARANMKAYHARRRAMKEASG